MRDLLVPIFGEWGAVVAQFIITVVIVLGLIGAVWWFVRRYSGVHFGGIGRGRVPRLAVIDVLAVDRRRRLVLVRRDNVEHLLLIGGPSDVVIEGPIHRVRQRGAQVAGQVAAARAAVQTAIEPPAAEAEAPPPEAAAAPAELPAAEPIPFPVIRNTARAETAASAYAEEPQPAAEPEPQTVVAASFVAPQRPTRLQSIQGRLAAAPPPPMPQPEAPQPEELPPEAPPAADAPQAAIEEDLPPVYAAAHQLPDEALLSAVMTAEAAPPAPQPEAEMPVPATFAEAEREAAEAARQSALDFGEAESDVEAPAMAAEDEPPMAPEPAAEGEPAPVETAAKVSDLEREMARLLGEITTRRTS